MLIWALRRAPALVALPRPRIRPARAGAVDRAGAGGGDGGGAAAAGKGAAAVGPEPLRPARPRLRHAIEALMKLSTGPVIAAILILGLIGAGPSRFEAAVFVALFVGQLAIFWFATGQAISNIGPFIHGTIEVAGGYSTAMMRLVDVPSWKVTSGDGRRDRPLAGGVRLRHRSAALPQSADPLVRDRPRRPSASSPSTRRGSSGPTPATSASTSRAPASSGSGFPGNGPAGWCWARWRSWRSVSRCARPGPPPTTA